MAEQPQYMESYRFRFTQEDLRELHQIRERSTILKMVLLRLYGSFSFLFKDVPDTPPEPSIVQQLGSSKNSISSGCPEILFHILC